MPDRAAEADETLITPEMIEAGADALWESGIIDLGNGARPLVCEAIAETIYRAMVAAEIPSCSDLVPQR